MDSSLNRNAGAIRRGVRIAGIGFVLCVSSVVIQSMLDMPKASDVIFYIGATIMIVGILDGLVRLFRSLTNNDS